jgi:hypothetical protein
MVILVRDEGGYRAIALSLPLAHSIPGLVEGAEAPDMPHFSALVALEAFQWGPTPG